MNKVMTVTGMLISGMALGVDLGSLDPTFSEDGVTDGWDMSGEMGYNRYGSDVAVDSQGRLYVVGTYDYDLNGNTVKGARLERRLPNGDLDTNFDSDGIRELGLPPAPQSQFEYEVIVDGSDGVFVGYSRLFCITNNDCESDLYAYHINTNGVIIGSQQIDFDLGSSNDRKDDDFVDMVYVPSINKLAIAAEVELSNADDTDFGIAVLNVNPTSGDLSLDTGFSADGKRQCYFDQNNAAGSRDKAEAIVWDPLLSRFIVGGSTFEGNGFGNDGWNMSFCEFDLAGNLVRDWSTMDLPDTLDDREFIADMTWVDLGGLGGTSALVVAGSLPGAGGLDTAVSRFIINQFGQWELDTSFGGTGTGFNTTGFQYIFIGDTSDNAVEMVVEEEDGAILVLSSIGWDESGSPKSAFALSRYNDNGSLDTTWGIGNGGKAVHTFDLSVRWDIAESIAVDPVTEEIYVSGTSYNGLEFESTVANMVNDRLFASDFD